ncbi:MAG: hypothetical protein RLN89_14810 [Parvibaculum sp.]
MDKFAHRVQIGCVAYFAAFTSSVSPVLAGAWPLPEGDTLAIVQVSHTLAHRNFDQSGNATSRGRFSKIEPQLYVEHGLTKQITLLGKFSRSTDQSVAFGQEFTDVNFRRAEIGARAYLFTWRETLYTVDVIFGRTLGASTNDPAASQSGDLDYEFGLTTGTTFTEFGLNGFNETRIAYRQRPGARPAEAKVDVTMGVHVNDQWLVMLKNQTENSLGRTPSPRGHFWANKGELSVVHDLEPGFSIEAGAFRTIAGRNVLKETGLKLAFWYRF